MTTRVTFSLNSVCPLSNSKSLVPTLQAASRTSRGPPFRIPLLMLLRLRHLLKRQSPRHRIPILILLHGVRRLPRAS